MSNLNSLELLIEKFNSDALSSKDINLNKVNFKGYSPIKKYEMLFILLKAYNESFINGRTIKENIENKLNNRNTYKINNYFNEDEYKWLIYEMLEIQKSVEKTIIIKKNVEQKKLETFLGQIIKEL